MTDSTNLVFHDIARFRTQLFDRYMRSHGLTTSQAWVIAHLFKANEQTQSQLAGRMRVGTVTLGGLIDRLEARGLVQRHSDPLDRRVNRVCLTDAAYSMHETMQRTVALVDEIAYRGLTQAQVGCLVKGLASVRTNLLDALREEKAGPPVSSPQRNT